MFTVTRITPAAVAQTAPPESVTIDARIVAKSAHAYFYADSTIDVAPADATRASEAFEERTWPAVTSVFGEPDTPGVDGDPRIVVLYAGLGGVGGYHSGDDLYLQSVRPESNEAEMVYLDSTLGFGSAAFNTILAHELQHLVHSHNDGGEEAWVNEGLSETARALAGGAIDTVAAFEAAPATQLDDWSSEDSRPHYGAAAAFFEYLAGRFGGDGVLGAVARAPGDGTAGIEQALRPFDAGISFRSVFADWIAANALNRASGPYGTPRRPMRMAFAGALAPGDAVNGDATQFGTAYYQVEAPGGEQQVLFEGARDVPVLPIEPLHGALLWSNAGDAIDTTLTREVDLTGVEAPALAFRAWWDIEPWYDWAYVSASDDGGRTWRALAGEHTTSDDPVRVAYGPGYTGKSDGGDTPWVDERIDLAPYAGKKMLLRFEYVTDGATHGRGFALDDVTIAGTDVQGGPPDASWVAAGWARVDRDLSQAWIVRVLATRADGEAVAIDVPIDAAGTGAVRFNADGLRDIVIAVAAATEGTTERAPYALRLARP